MKLAETSGPARRRRLALAPRRVAQRLDEDPAQEAGRVERKRADGHQVPGAADDVAAIVHDDRERPPLAQGKGHHSGKPCRPL